MSVWGKVIGGVTGFAMGGPLGAFLGVIAGHAVDRSRGRTAERIVSWAQNQSQKNGGGHRGHAGYSQEERQIAFSVAVIVLGAKLAKVDGVVSRAEVDAFKEIFQIPAADVPEVAKVFDEARQEATGFESYAEQIADMIGHETRVLEELLGGLFHIAKADGALSPAERSYLRAVARIFGFNERDFNRILVSHIGNLGGSDRIDPYAVLGVNRNNNNTEIKSAYRKLIRENHPDTLIAQGMPPEFVAVANEKMAAINAAYDVIEKERGLR